MLCWMCLQLLQGEADATWLVWGAPMRHSGTVIAGESMGLEQQYLHTLF
jgi:hypothetical protein